MNLTSLKYRPDYTGIPDHISVELELMQKIAQREAKAWEEDREGALRCLKEGVIRGIALMEILLFISFGSE